MNSVWILISVVVAFAVTALLGKWMIPLLHKLKFGQTIREVGPAWHKKKQGTPTMGGLMFIIGIAVAVAIGLSLAPSFGEQQTKLMYVKTVAGLAMAVCFGFIGFLDDYISIIKKRNLGLTERQKLMLQFLTAGAYLLSVRLAGGDTKTTIPFLGRLDLGFFYYILAALVIVGIVNAVNFTDGIDGMNSIVCFFMFLSLALCASMRMASGMVLLGYAAAAGCLGFLIWNFNPAKVFMGDTGSLFFGGIACALAFGIDMPVLLLPAAIISIIEILSVVLQVSYFKATHGKRIFKMAPIHHHFEMLGWSEIKICAVFGSVSLLGGLTALALVYFGV